MGLSTLIGFEGFEALTWSKARIASANNAKNAANIPYTRSDMFRSACDYEYERRLPNDQMMWIEPSFNTGIKWSRSQ